MNKDYKIFLFKFFLGMSFIANIHALGIFTNHVALRTNGMMMPVYDKNIPFGYVSHDVDNIHFYYDDFSKVNNFYLTDLFIIRNGEDSIGVYSIGDILQYVTIPMMVIWGMIGVYINHGYYKRAKDKENKRKHDRK